MSDTTESKNIRNDEIDLLELFRRFGNTTGKMFRAIGKGIVISIVFLFRNWLPLGLSLVLGVGISYLFKFAAPSLYTSELVLRTNTPPSSDYITYVNRLHTFCQENNYNALMKAISISEKEAMNIKDIYSYWIIDRGKDGIADFVDYKKAYDPSDTINVRMKDRLDIKVIIEDPQELTIVRNGLISYIESDSLFQQRNRVRLRQNQDLLARYDNDISQLDSLQKIKYFEETKKFVQPGAGQILFLQEPKTQLIYSDIHELFIKKQYLELEKSLYNDVVTVLSEFTIPAKRENSGIYYGRVIIPLTFAACVLILILFKNRKKLIEIYRNN